MTQWLRYPSLERWGTGSIEGIETCPTIYVMPKIDGANAAVFLDDNGVLQCASRNHVLDESKPSFQGLQEYVKNNKDSFMALLHSLPNDAVVYGEWLVKHTIKYYKEDAWNKFYVFDIRIGDTFMDSVRVTNECFELDIPHVPIIAKLTQGLVTDNDVELVYELMKNNRFLLPDDAPPGEGVVVKGFTKDGLSFRNKWGNLVWAKFVNSEFTEKNSSAFGPREISIREHEKDFANLYVTSGRVEKIKAKVCVEKGTEWSSKYIGEVLGRVYHDVFTEELWGFVKEHKAHNINFKTLQKCVMAKARMELGL